MAEDIARALGAGQNGTVKIGGKECYLRPLTLLELAEIERDCLDQYRDSYLRTYAQHMDKIPKDMRFQIMQENMEKAAKWDINDLPSKTAYDSKHIVINKQIRRWLVENIDLEKEKSEERMKLYVTTALDEGLLTEEKYKELTKGNLRKVSIGYVNWWITGSFDGQIAILVACFRSEGITKDQLVKEMRGNPSLLMEIASTIESLSAPAVGNG